MTNKYWFKPKRYGYGASPSTWEGWLLTFVFIFLVIYEANRINTSTQFFIEIIIAVIIFSIFVNKKTDGKWKWRWGNK